MFDIRKIQEQVIYDAVKQASDAVKAEEVVFGRGGAAKAETDGEWVTATMGRLEKFFIPSDVRQIRRNCQCGYGMDDKLLLVKGLMAQSSGIEEFGNLKQANEAGIFYEQGKLYLQFPFCPCPMLADVERLETDTWCQCTTGYSKVLFERAFGCEVDVELLESVKMGDERCLMEIIPRGAVW